MKTPTLAQFEKWYDDLSPLDRTNINMLLTLPKGGKLIGEFPPGKVRDMASFGHGLLRVAMKIVQEK